MRLQRARARRVDVRKAPGTPRVEAGTGGGFEAIEEGNFGKQVMQVGGELGIKAELRQGSNVIVTA